jgi:hypothetical protein
MSRAAQGPQIKGCLAVSTSFFSQIPCFALYFLNPLNIAISRLDYSPSSPRNTAVRFSFVVGPQSFPQVVRPRTPKMFCERREFIAARVISSSSREESIQWLRSCFTAQMPI